MTGLHTLFAVLTALMLVLLVQAWRLGGSIRFARWRSLRRRLKAAREEVPPPPSGHGDLSPQHGGEEIAPLPADAGAAWAAGVPDVANDLNGPNDELAAGDGHDEAANITLPPALPGAGLPRLLMLGDGSAGLAALLSTAAPDTPPHVPDTDGDAPFWRWWALPRMVLIEVRPPPAAPHRPHDTAWLSALRALACSSPQRPLDGLVLCASAALLGADPAVSGPTMQLLARRLHESAAALCMRLPVHVLVTGLQDLPGYARVRAALPDAVAAQAVGWRPAPGQPEPALHEVMLPIGAALHALRLGLLADAHDAQQRHDIHRFVEAMLALKAGMQRLHAALDLEGDPRTPLQGLYVTASGPQGAFVHDLFTHFLPAGCAVARDMR